jgi:drug/metabolite transporter (DMT)-like permease
VLVLAVLGISFAAPLVRLSAAHPVAIATWRLAFSVAIIGVVLLVGGQWRQWRTLARGDLVLALGAGVLLALHFWSWNASIGLTTVAASVVLVNLQPVFVALGSALWLREPPSRTQLAGIAVAMLGALVVAWQDVSAGGAPGRNPVLGDLLAIIGAITAAGYYLAGRRLRASLDLWPYVGLVYGACLAVLLVLALVMRVPLLPQPSREFAIFAGLALGPMLLGHTGMNWALGHVPAYVVSLTLLGEPVGATIIAALLPGIAEVPSLGTLLGGALILSGILVTARRR